MANLDDPLKISEWNSTATPLGSGAAFTGLWENIRSFAEVDLVLKGSASGVAPGTLIFEFSATGSVADISVPLAFVDINNAFTPVPLRVVLPFFRARFINGATAHTTFRLVTAYHSITSARLTRFLDQSIGDNEPIEIAGAVLKARNTAGTYSNIQLDGSGNLPVSGEVDVNNFPAVQPVSGTVSVGNFPAIQNVAVTSTVETEIKNDAGNPVPVSGTVTANAGTGPFPVSDNGGSLTVDGTVSVGNFPAVQPVSDNGGSLTVDGVFFQATQPVSAASLPLPTGASTEATLAALLPARSSSAVVTSVAASASNVTLLSLNANRDMATIYNDSAFRLFLKLGSTASSSSFTVRIDSQGYYELPLPCYTGQIDGIWTGATGNARITELS